MKSQICLNLFIELQIPTFLFLFLDVLPADIETLDNSFVVGLGLILLFVSGDDYALLAGILHLQSKFTQAWHSVEPN
jgi:hypothetical protein